jgi:hypothetical protein
MIKFPKPVDLSGLVESAYRAETAFFVEKIAAERYYPTFKFRFASS